MRWISSGDLRLIPDEIFKRCVNKELNIEAFRTAAVLLLENPFVGAIYGLDDTGVIRQAVCTNIDARDFCLYVDNLFGADLKDPGLLEALRIEQEKVQAQAVKLHRADIMNVGG